MESNIVSVMLWGDEVGKLYWDDRGKRAVFSYNPDFVKKGTDIAPLTASVRGAAGKGLPVVGSREKLYQGLPPFLADSLPDHWGNKVFELDGKTIDVVWNGMTLTDEVLSSMECSNAYCNNAQVVILPAAEAENYPDAASMAELQFAVESGSAGMDMAIENGFSYTEVIDQATAVLEVSSGTCQAAIIDSLMAAAMVGEGTSYADLTYTISLNSEEYGVGFRKGSDLCAALNDFFAAAWADGTMQELADTYGVSAALIAQG